ncbi:hypothetical protein CHARACLAT_026895 [Characodon lateralis]|uniref:Secreted protein n=1 Tax=Characodon lateralis TaxID=208331 RepID=A0ABU7F6T2_9TELE|nr:hypothetical protein [Characodon lateralis]
MILPLMFFLLLCSAPAFLDCYSLLSCVVTVHSSRFVMSASALIYPPCSFAQGASDCICTHSKPLRFSRTNLGLRNPRFYENRHSPLKSGVYWFLKGEEKSLLWEPLGCAPLSR